MRKIQRRDWAVLGLALFHTTHIATNQFAPSIIDDLGLSIITTEIILSLNAISATIFLLLAGEINERIGMRKSTILGLSLVSISGLIPLVFRNELSIILNRLILGTGVGIYATNSSTYIGIFNKGAKKAKLMGYRNAFEMIGLIMAILLAGVMGKDDLYLSFAIYPLALIPLIFFLRNVSDLPRAKKEDSGKFRVNKFVIFYIALSMVTIMTNNAMNLRFPTVLAVNGVLGESISLYTIFIMFVGMVGGFAFGKFYDIFGKKSLNIAILMMIGGSLLIAIRDDSIILLVLGLALATFAQSICISYAVGDLGNHIGPSHISKATGLMFAGNNLGAMASPFALVLFKNLLNTENLTRVFLGFAALLALFLIYDLIFLKESN
ncbi:MFS transporter [Anaerococcus sp.]|uniref:MFS transporter n=1 Tax=Anaerococcus sp. TaxID=1872515 RepID=UPI0027BAB1FD|nr:MFS transporter [Anaerococcus sp.]